MSHAIIWDLDGLLPHLSGIQTAARQRAEREVGPEIETPEERLAVERLERRFLAAALRTVLARRTEALAAIPLAAKRGQRCYAVTSLPEACHPLLQELCPDLRLCVETRSLQVQKEAEDLLESLELAEGEAILVTNRGEELDAFFHIVPSNRDAETLLERIEKRMEAAFELPTPSVLAPRAARKEGASKRKDKDRQTLPC